MKIFASALALLIAAAAFATPHVAFAQASSSEPLDGIVAVVDEDVVLKSELDRQVNRVLAQYASSPQQLPPRDVLERQVLERLILQKLQVTRAESNGVKISDGTPEAVRNDQKVVAAYLGVEDEEVEKVEAEVGL